MSEEKVKNNIAYVFITYQLNKLQDQGFVTKEEAERLVIRHYASDWAQTINFRAI